MKNIKISYKNNEFKISTPQWNEEFELPGWSNIKDYFKHIFKKHETVTDNPLLRTYVNKIENRITFKVKTGYYLELLTLEIMKLDENVSLLEIAEVVLIHFNIVKIGYQQDSRAFYTFALNKSFDQLLDIPEENLYS